MGSRRAGVKEECAIERERRKEEKEEEEAEGKKKLSFHRLL